MSLIVDRCHSRCLLKNPPNQDSRTLAGGSTGFPPIGGALPDIEKDGAFDVQGLVSPRQHVPICYLHRTSPD